MSCGFDGARFLLPWIEYCGGWANAKLAVRSATMKSRISRFISILLACDASAVRTRVLRYECSRQIFSSDPMRFAASLTPWCRDGSHWPVACIVLSVKVRRRSSLTRSKFFRRGGGAKRQPEPEFGYHRRTRFADYFIESSAELSVIWNTRPCEATHMRAVIAERAFCNSTLTFSNSLR